MSEWPNPTLDVEFFTWALTASSADLELIIDRLSFAMLHAQNVIQGRVEHKVDEAVMRVLTEDLTDE